ncbi:MAG: hypothetical protein HQ445_14060 [Polaromonas sp.]|nr:hypothetical protein [Polaromonas sp.]
MTAATAAKPKAKTPALKPAPVLTLGATIDKMWQLREDKRAAEVVTKGIELQIKALESTMFELLDAQDTTKAQGKSASVSISETVVGDVEDWETFWPYIAKNKFFHLVQKRVSDPALRELWGMKKVIPGVQPFTKRTLNVRSL